MRCRPPECDRRPSAPVGAVGHRVSFLLLLALFAVAAGCGEAEEQPSVSMPAATATIGTCMEAARARFGQLDLDGALASVGEVLALDPQHHDARLLEAVIRSKMGELDAAAKVLEELRRDFPGDSQVTRRLAFVRKQRGEWTKAIELFESLPPRERTPTMDDAMVYAEALANALQLRKAADAVANVLIPDPWYARAYLLLTQIDDRRGRTAQAEVWADRYRSEQPLRDAQQVSLGHERRGARLLGLNILSEAMFRGGYWHAAWTLSQQAIQTDPRRKEAYFDLCRVYCELGRIADARALVEKMPRSARVHAALGDVNVAAEEYVAAVREYEEACALEPDNETWRQALAAARVKRDADLSADPLAESRRAVRRRIEGQGVAAAGREYLTLARLRAREGDMDRARALAMFALRLAPQDPATLRAVIELHSRPRDAFVRICLANRILRREPEAADVRAGLVEDLLFVDARLDLARVHLRRLLAAGRTADRLVLEARVERAAGRTDRALASLGEALSLDPDHEEARRLRAAMKSAGNGAGH